MAGTRTVYASIGNSDDKLTQARWSEFHDKVTTAVRGLALQVYGDWTSASVDPWQNACIAFEIGWETSERLQRDLGELAAEYDQDSIAWAEADTRFITPAAAAPATDLVPNTLADDILDWVREHPWDAEHIPTEPLTIDQSVDGTVRLVDVPDAFTIDIALLRAAGLRGVAFAGGTLAIDGDDTVARYEVLYAYDYGFSIACRRES
jgi:hypothetical protein